MLTFVSLCLTSRLQDSNNCRASAAQLIHSWFDFNTIVVSIFAIFVIVEDTTE